MDSYEKLYSALAKHGHKVTSARKQVYAVLASTPLPLSNADVIKRVTKADKVTVYRTLELFDAIGVTHRVWNGFKSKVELSDPYSPHHHHFTCTGCGNVKSFTNKYVEYALKNIEQNMNITISSHVIELGGQCENCNAKVALPTQK